MVTSWKVIAAFLGVFIAGAVFGGFFSVGMGARWLRDQPVPVAAPASTSPAPAPTNHPKANGNVASGQRPNLLQVPQTWQAPMLMRRYAERLELTPEQKERITPVFQRATEDYRRVQQNTFRETAIILQRLQQDLAKELTPEQRAKLAKMEERQREALQKMEQRQREQKKGNGRGKGGAAPTSGAPSATSASPSTAAPAAAASGSESAAVPATTTSTASTAATATPSAEAPASTSSTSAPSGQ